MVLFLDPFALAIQPFYLASHGERRSPNIVSSPGRARYNNPTTERIMPQNPALFFVLLSSLLRALLVRIVVQLQFLDILSRHI